MMNQGKLLIGVVGPIAAGKWLVTEYLIKKYSFESFSLSTIIHQELSQQGITSYTRKDLQDIGNELRQRFGADVLARRAFEIISKKRCKRVVIEGIRNPAEVRFFQEKANPSVKDHYRFFLLAVKAYRHIRYIRIIERAKPWDPKSWPRFLEINRRDLGKNEALSGQHVSACIKMADYSITNNKGRDQVYEKIDKLMKRII